MTCIIKTTKRCNLNCKYCGVIKDNKNSDLNIKDAYLFIDKLNLYSKNNNINEINFIFHGGEPLVRDINFYLNFINYANKKLSGYKLDFNIQTNGYLINNDWIEFIKKYDIGICVSLDGIENTHNTYRVLENNKPTFNKILENIKTLQQNNINFSILMVISDIYLGQEKEIYNFLKNNKLFRCKINPVIRYNNADINDIKISKLTYAKFLIEMFKIWICDGLVSINPLNGIIGSILHDKNMTECVFNNSCGKNFICLDSNGDIYPCGRFSDIETLKIGNINEIELNNETLNPIFSSLINRREILKKTKCKNCKYLKYCNSGCAMSGYIINNDLNSKTLFCDDYKYLFNYMLTDGLKIIKDLLINYKQFLKFQLKALEND